MAQAVVATPPTEVAATLRSNAELTRDHLQAVVDHVRLLFFEAYDGMGYVFWTPSGQAMVEQTFRDQSSRSESQHGKEQPLIRITCR